MEPLELTPQQVEKLNAALAGKPVDLADDEMATLNKVLAARKQAQPPAPANAPAVHPEAEPWQPEEAHTKAGAALQGVAHGASFGFADELAGLVKGGVAGLGRLGLSALQTAPGRAAVRAAMPNLRNVSDDVLDAILEQAGQTTAQTAGLQALPQGPGEAARTGYVTGRNEARREDAQAAEAHPVAHGLGEVAGAVAMPLGAGKALGTTKGLAILPGVAGGVRLSPLAARLAVTGGMAGGLAGAGNSTADLVDPQAAAAQGGAGALLEDTLGGAGKGFATGAILGGAANKAAPYLKRLAQESAARAAGLAPGISNRAQTVLSNGGERVTEDTVRDFGQRMLDAGYVKAGRTPEGVMKAGQEEVPRWIAAQQAAYAMGDATGTTPSLDVAGQVGKQALMRAYTKVGQRELGKALQSAEDIAAENGSSWARAGRIKSELQGRINWSNPDAPIAMEAQRNLARGFKDALAWELGQVAGPEAEEGLRLANSRLADLYKLQELASNQGTREMAKNKLGSLIGAGLGTGISALLGHGADSTMGGAAAGGAYVGHALGRMAAPYVPATAAVAQQAMSRAAVPAARLATVPLVELLAESGDKKAEARRLAEALRKKKGD